AAPGMRRRLQVLASRQYLRIVGAAADADHLLDLVVVGGHVRVGDRPGDLPAVSLGGLEGHLGVAEADPSPHVGLAAVAPDADELEGLAFRSEVGLLLGVEEELGRVVALRQAYPRLPRPDVGPERRAVELVARVEKDNLDA